MILHRQYIDIEKYIESPFVWINLLIYLFSASASMHECMCLCVCVCFCVSACVCVCVFQGITCHDVCAQDRGQSSQYLSPNKLWILGYHAIPCTITLSRKSHPLLYLMNLFLGMRLVFKLLWGKSPFSVQTILSRLFPIAERVDLKSLLCPPSTCSSIWCSLHYPPCWPRVIQHKLLPHYFRLLSDFSLCSSTQSGSLDHIPPKYRITASYLNTKLEYFQFVGISKHFSTLKKKKNNNSCLKLSHTQHLTKVHVFRAQFQFLWLRETH